MSAAQLSAIAQLLGGRLHGADAAFEGVSTDSRSLQPGNLFIALRGPNFDAHSFLQAAAAAGAAGALVEEPGEAPLPQVVVSDSRSALGQLGAHWRGQHSPRTVAVTGSNGKTTVKEMIATILALRGPVLATAGNFNNDIGVPLTLLRLGREHRSAVVEIGSSAPGEIAPLAAMAAPTVSVVTNAGPAHLEGFGSLEQVAREKGALFSALPAGGIAIINADDAYAPLWQQMAVDARQLTFGSDPDADFRFADVRTEADGHLALTLETPDGSLALQLPLAGAHNAANAACAAAAAWAAGATTEDIIAGLAAVRGVSGRLQLRSGHSGARILDDSYNANPASAAAAIDFLVGLAGRHWLVIGDMGELGARSAALHEELGRVARARGVEQLFAVGEQSAATAKGFGPGATHYSDVATLIAALQADLAPDLCILVKGSRSARMERVVEALCAPAAGPAAGPVAGKGS